MSQSPINFLREAAPYIQQHRDKTFVIAFPGETIQSDYFAILLQDIAILSSLGSKIVLVHGARPQVDSELAQIGHTLEIQHDLRVTDKKTLDIAMQIIGGLRVGIENKLSFALNKPPVINDGIGIISGNFITAKPIGIRHGIDYQYTGEVRKVNIKRLQQQLELNHIVLLSPLGFSPTGEAFNLRYEEIACTTAQALQADKLIFIDDFNKNLPSHTDSGNIDTLIQKHPKQQRLLEHIDHAMQQGVDKVHLINQKTDGALLMELFSLEGEGTLISREYDSLREANINDVSGIINLIEPLEQEGKLIKRSREQLELEINNFSVIERDSTIIGCAALYPTNNSDIAELACLAVHAQYHQNGLGIRLLTHIESQAKTRQCKQLLVLTTQSIDWFKERGFKLKDVDDLPTSKQELYNYQRNSKVLFKEL